MSRRFCEPAGDASYVTGTELAVDGGFLPLGPEMSHQVHIRKNGWLLTNSCSAAH